MKISVITINYNDKLGLKKTFDSVFNQTFKDFEYLVIDGSSTDGSKELIEENALKINYWISEKDTGVYNAMNKGIKAAKGEYLIFMNSGDCFADENVLEKTKQLINSEAAIYYGDVIFIGQNEQRKYKYDMEISYNFFRNNSFCHQSTFIKKTLFESIFYYNEKFPIRNNFKIFVIIENRLK